MIITMNLSFIRWLSEHTVNDLTGTAKRNVKASRGHASLGNFEN